MARDTTDFRPIEGMDELVAHLAEGNKPRDAWRIGTEHEKFPFYVDGNAPVPYGGPRGIRALLEGMQQTLGWEPILDEGRIIGLVEPTGQGAISLEPGGQFELSGAPVETIHQTCREGNAHLAQLREIAEPLGIRFLGLGGSPKWSLADTPKMPKSRYDIMTRYMPKVGTKGFDMMYRTCTIQVNLDFSSEADMRRKMQVSLKLQPLSTALFANSPFTEGKPNGLVSWRGDIWTDTDNQRSGLLDFCFSPEFGFADYVEWALDVPMYFVIREGRYHDMTRYTFRQFMAGKARDAMPDGVPNIGDWANHLSTLFPDVRLKRFLEMRGADGGPWRRICALPAFWVGLLYDEEALAAAEAMTADWQSVLGCYDIGDELYILIDSINPIKYKYIPDTFIAYYDIPREGKKLYYDTLMAYDLDYNSSTKSIAFKIDINGEEFELEKLARLKPKKDSMLYILVNGHINQGFLKNIEN